MLDSTRGIVLRSVKYGDTSLISTVFTEKHGIQSYLVQGVRSTKSKTNKASLLQPGMLLNMVVYHKPNTNLQRIREFQYAYIYNSVQQEIIKNSIAIFSVELLLRLLPEHAPMPELFDFAFYYFEQLDKLPATETANLPVYFTIQCSKLFGYEIHGEYSTDTPHLNLQEGAFTHHLPQLGPYATDDEAKALSALLQQDEVQPITTIALNAEMRNRILDWLLDFLKQHTQHMGSIKSLEVLRAILH
jgi:DNA repair protein RecO (recombination protein O)